MVLVLYAVAMTAILILAAMVIDLGDARQMSRQAQASSDSAALAGVQYVPSDATKAKNAAAKYAANNILGSLEAPASTTCPVGSPAASSCYTVTGATITVATPYTLGTLPSSRLVYVKICRPTGAQFGRIVGATSTNVCRESVARNLVGTPATGIGLLAIEELGECTGDSNGGGHVKVAGGAIVVNSSNSTALCGNSNGLQFEADYIGVVGGYKGKEENFSVTPGTGIDAVADPFIGLPNEPLPSEYPELAVTFTKRSDACTANVCKPGVYDFAINTTTNFLPGAVRLNKGYKLNGGDSMNSVADGSGLIGNLIYIPSGGSGVVNGNPTMDLRPMSTGTFAGLSIYQNRSNVSPLVIGGNPSQQMGSIYAKLAPVTVGGNVTTVINGIVVVNEFRINGGGASPINVLINVPNDAPTLPSIPDIGLER